MLYALALAALLLWLLGIVTSYTLGGVIHVLVVIALVLLVMKVLGPRAAR